MEERELVRRAMGGDTEAFEQLFLAYRGHAFALATSILHDAAEAADVTHDAFLTALEELPRLREPSRFASWLTTIVRRKAYRRLRRDGGWTEVTDLAELPSLWDRHTPDRAVLAAEAANRLREAIEELPACLSEALNLKYGKGLSYSEIATALSVPVVTIKSRLHEARTQMRQSLAGLEAMNDLEGLTLSTKNMPYPWPAIRVQDAEQVAAHVDLVEFPLDFLRLEVGASSETVTFHYWDWSTWAPPRWQGRVTRRVVGEATVEEEPCVEVRLQVYKPDGESLRSEITEFAGVSEAGFLRYLTITRGVEGTTGVGSLVSRDTSPEPLWPVRIAVGQTHVAYGKRLIANRWVDLALSGQRVRCIEVISEIWGAKEGQARHDRHYISEDGRTALMLRYDTDRTWEHRPDVEPLVVNFEGRDHYVERSTVPAEYLRQRAT